MHSCACRLAYPLFPGPNPEGFPEPPRSLAVVHFRRMAIPNLSVFPLSTPCARIAVEKTIEIDDRRCSNRLAQKVGWNRFKDMRNEECKATTLAPRTGQRGSIPVAVTKCTREDSNYRSCVEGEPEQRRKLSLISAVAICPNINTGRGKMVPTTLLPGQSAIRRSGNLFLSIALTDWDPDDRGEEMDGKRPPLTSDGDEGSNGDETPQPSPRDLPPKKRPINLPSREPEKPPVKAPEPRRTPRRKALTRNADITEIKFSCIFGHSSRMLGAR